MANNIESQIYNNFLKPSISTIERTMKTNFEEVKSKLRTLSAGNNINNIDTNRFSVDSNFDNELHFKSIGSRERKMDTKIDEINHLGERLYEKLLEKEKKLNDLKNETTSYLKKKKDSNINKY
jgi:hypothetical protein